MLLVGVDVTERIEEEQARLTYETKLRSMTEERLASEEQGRRALAIELHDQIGQTLALAQIKLGALGQAAPAGLAAPVAEVRELLSRAIQSSRSLTIELGATILHELGLEAALDSLAEDTQARHGLNCSFSDDGQSKPLRTKPSWPFTARHDENLASTSSSTSEHSGSRSRWSEHRDGCTCGDRRWGRIRCPGQAAFTQAKPAVSGSSASRSTLRRSAGLSR